MEWRSTIYVKEKHPMISWKSLYKVKIRESVQLKTVVELYDMEIHQKILMPSYQKLKTVVKRSTDQKLRLRNFEARHRRIETGAGLVKSGKRRIEWVLIDQKNRLRNCHARHRRIEKGASVRKEDQCSFRAWELNDRAQKTRTHCPPSSSEPSMSRGRSVSRKRSIQGKSNRHGAILRQPCR